MALPLLYKFLDVAGAKLTLGNRTFKHAKPSDFNDTEDLTIQSIFPEDVELALARLSQGLPDVILQHLDDEPTCAAPLKEKVATLQQVFRSNPEVAAIVKAEMAKAGGEPLYDMEHMRKRVEDHIADINLFMQAHRVLCVTAQIQSEQMWSGYAENHKGIALRIEPNLAKDSKFSRFRPVEYQQTRPPLYEDTRDFAAGSLFGDQEARMKRMLDRIIYTKTLEWQHETEYRLVIPLVTGEEPWNTLPYHPEEIAELYLGLAMEQADQDVILSLAAEVNPEMRIFAARRGAQGALEFSRV